MSGRFRPTAFFETLARHDVDYVAIGGVAAIAHGSRRATFDLDIVPAPFPENYRRLAQALAALEVREARDADFQNLDPTDDVDLARARVLSVDTDAGRIDIVNRPAGAPPYGDLRARSVESSVGGVSVRLAGLDDLIAMKRAAGRPTDLADIAEITDPPAG